MVKEMICRTLINNKITQRINPTLPRYGTDPIVSAVSVNKGSGQYRNAVASGSCDFMLTSSISAGANHHHHRHL